MRKIGGTSPADGGPAVTTRIRVGEELPGGRRAFFMRYLLAVLAALQVGCHQGVYDAGTLPPQFAALPLTNVQTLDLSNLSSPVAVSQRVQPGDTLNVVVVTGTEDRRPETWPLDVSEDGSAQIPLVGRVQLAGLTLQEAQATVREASIRRGIYRQPSVSVALERRKTNKITVMGAVAEPGSYDMPTASSDLLSAIVAAGGLSEEADTTIEIRQPPAVLPPPSTVIADPKIATASYHPADVAAGPQLGGTPPRVTIDMISATQRPVAGGYRLADGAVVMVRRRPERYIHVLGLVQRPDQFELPSQHNVRVLDAIAMAGGLRVSIADKVLVVRQMPGRQEPVTIEVSMREAKEDNSENLLLADGDVVSVEETPVTLVVGAIQQFLRFGINGSVGVF